MIVLFAPDSFKGSLTSVQVARALADGWHRARPDDELLLCPLADGGEGTLEAVAAAGGWEWRTTVVARIPLGRPVDGPLAVPERERRRPGRHRDGRSLRPVAGRSGRSRSDGRDQRRDRATPRPGHRPRRHAHHARHRRQCHDGRRPRPARWAAVRWTDVDRSAPGRRRSRRGLRRLEPTPRAGRVRPRSSVRRRARRPEQVAGPRCPQRGLGRRPRGRGRVGDERDTPGRRRGGRRRIRAARDPGSVPVVRAATWRRARHGGDRLRRPPRPARISSSRARVGSMPRPRSARRRSGVARRAQTAGKSCIAVGGGVEPEGVDALAAVGATAVPVWESPVPSTSPSPPARPRSRPAANASPEAGRSVDLVHGLSP